MFVIGLTSMGGFGVFMLLLSSGLGWKRVKISSSLRMTSLFLHACLNLYPNWR